MEKYQDTVSSVLTDGNYRPNRTGVDTISLFGNHTRYDVSERYPLLTTKKMDTYRWDSMLHEFVWYFSGQHHIRDLKEETKIWNAWADDDYNLPTAYGRFWRRFPVPDAEETLDGEWWPTNVDDWGKTAADHYGVSEETVRETVSSWLTEENSGRTTFDQMQYIVDTLRGENPLRPAKSRRLVVNAWHPANADVSKLPPCHYTFLFNVQGDKLNLHMTQRSADIALGVPFNIAAYALMLKYVASLTGYEPGTFSHFLGDAHVYCGKGDRGEWYRDNLNELQSRLDDVSSRDDYRDIRNWVLENAPSESDDNVDPTEHNYGYDHVPGLLEQLAREPWSRPTLSLDVDELDELTYEDVDLQDYESHGGLSFGVAE